MEDLNIKKMVEGSHLAKSITDASWNQFRQFLTYKAAEAGRKLGVVNPAYTTQICNRCQHREKKTLAKESIVALNAVTRLAGISTQRKIFWPSD